MNIWPVNFWNFINYKPQNAWILFQNRIYTEQRTNEDRQDDR